MLNDQQIDAVVLEQEVISPYSRDSLNPVSYDLHLGNNFKVPDSNIKNYFDNVDVPVDGYFHLRSLHFVLAHTMEYIKVPEHLTLLCVGKSTIARNGLMIESAGFIDPGFEGNITLELFNQICWTSDLKVGMPICQITFFENDSPELKCYKKVGHYNSQRGATLPRYYL